MKFNRFLTVPTFSLLHEENTSISALVRNTNVEFNDAPRLYLASYSGKMRENTGAGIAVYQQELGVFKDFGAIANYAYQVRLSEKTNLTFGFNFMYSRRSADGQKVLTPTGSAPTLDNYQETPVVNLQPAVTLSFGKIDLGVFFENLVDYNLKKNEMVSPFSEKIISGHAMYTHNFENASGLFQNTAVRFLGVARKEPEGFGYSGNVIVDLPKVGWAKAAYDKTYGIQAGVGVNLSEKLSIGFSYEKGDLGATNEVGLIYALGKTRRSSKRSSERTNDKNPTVNITLPSNEPIKEPTIERREEEYKNPEHNDLSDEIRIAQDSINQLNKKVEEVLRLLKNQPKSTQPIIIRDTVRVQPETKDTSLRRSNKTPWREKTITRSGGGGVAYFVAVNQFKSLEKTKKLVAKYKKRKVDAKYVRDPKTKFYYTYIERYRKEEDADRLVKEINGSGSKGFENDEANDLGIKMKSVSSDPVYVVKVDFGDNGGGSYKEPKKQGRAKVRTMRLMDGLEPGYYLQVSVNSKKEFADKFIDELRADNISADYFVNPRTGYRHVYIYKTNNREEAINMYNSNLNGTYYNAKNIIHIR